MPNLSRLSLLAGFLLLAGSCSRPAPEKPQGPVKRYVMHGEIMQLNPKVPAALIKHSEIVGWMEAMTMEYPVKDKAEFDRLRQGEHITATVFVQGLDYSIGEIQEEKQGQVEKKQ